jgi:beta-glucosidase-like glycosyl hydrolase
MIKHFCVNNCDINRNSIDSRVSELAFREIYLRGFQRAVEEGGALVIMSSYNHLNGPEVSENRNLITEVLRGEWGFEGFVCTDWFNDSNQTKEVLAGNNIKMPGKHRDGVPVEGVLIDLSEGKITREKLVENAERIFGTILKAYEYGVKK